MGEYLLNGIPICPRFIHRECHEMECPSCIENGCKRIPGLDNYDSVEIDSKIPFFDQHTVGMKYPFNTLFYQIVLIRGYPGIPIGLDYTYMTSFDPQFFWGKEGSYKVSKSKWRMLFRLRVRRHNGNGEIEVRRLAIEGLLNNQNLYRDYEILSVDEFTGLKDCKRTKEYPEGQEIYGGDIVRRIATDNGKVFWDFIAVIKYNDECMAFKFEKIRDIEDNIESSDLVADIITEEVLGNIYDNPELLED